jgi:hypothetical protein
VHHQACLEFLAQAKCSREPGAAGVLVQGRKWVPVPAIRVASAPPRVGPDFRLHDPHTGQTLQARAPDGVSVDFAVAGAVLMLGEDAAAAVPAPTSWDGWLQRIRRLALPPMTRTASWARAVLPYLVGAGTVAALGTAMVYYDWTPLTHILGPAQQAWQKYQRYPSLLDRQLLTETNAHGGTLDILSMAGHGPDVRRKTWTWLGLLTLLLKAFQTAWQRQATMGLYGSPRTIGYLDIVKQQLAPEWLLVQDLWLPLLGAMGLLLAFWAAFRVAKGSTRVMLTPVSKALARACADLDTRVQTRGVGVFHRTTFGVYPSAAEVDPAAAPDMPDLLGVLEMRRAPDALGVASGGAQTVTLTRRAAWLWGALQWGTDTLLGPGWANMSSAGVPVALFTKGGSRARARSLRRRRRP